MMMTIPRDKYDELKPFYDFQRQKEFNKDWCRAVVQKVCSLADGILGENEDSATELLWEHLKEEDYQTPPKNIFCPVIALLFDFINQSIV